MARDKGGADTLNYEEVDIYDALRTPHRYKPSQSHAAACRAILQGDRYTSPGHFAPHLLDAFGRSERRLDAACREDSTPPE